jgi:tripartite ATP-independent transporter DctP family solute receptor
MDRRKFITRAAGAALATGTLATFAAPASAQARTLKLGYILPKESQLGAGAAAIAKEIAARTGGRLKVEEYPNSALGGEVEMVKAMQAGTIDMGFITGAPLPNFVPEVGAVNIPFLFTNAAHAQKALDGAIGQELLAKFEAKDLVALAWGENGMRHLTNSKRPIASPEDLKGLKLRLPQSPAMLAGFKTLGADAAALPFPELYAALETGKFDGQENPIATIASAKFPKVQKYLTLSGHVYDPAVFLISKDSWEDLSPADRDAMKAAAKIGGTASRTAAAEAEAKYVAQFKADGMQVVETVDKAKFAAAVKDAGFEKLYDPAIIARLHDAK